MDIITPPKTNPLAATDLSTNQNNNDDSNDLANLSIHPLFRGAFRDVSNDKLEPLTLNKPALDLNNIFGVDNSSRVPVEVGSHSSNPFLQLLPKLKTTSDGLKIDELTGLPSDGILVGLGADMFVQLEKNPQKVDPNEGIYWAAFEGLGDSVIGFRALANASFHTLSFGFYEGNIAGLPENPEELRLYNASYIGARTATESSFLAFTLLGNAVIKGAQATTQLSPKGAQLLSGVNASQETVRTIRGINATQVATKLGPRGVQVLHGFNTVAQVGETAQAIGDTRQGILAFQRGETGASIFYVSTGLIGFPSTAQSVRGIFSHGSKSIHYANHGEALFYDLKPGEGLTNEFGNIILFKFGTDAEKSIAKNHELVHSFLSPDKTSFLAKTRADLKFFGYNKSQLLRYTEEAASETFAQLRSRNLTGKSVKEALSSGLSFPLEDKSVKEALSSGLSSPLEDKTYEITKKGLIREGSGLGVVSAGALGGSYYLGSKSSE